MDDRAVEKAAALEILDEAGNSRSIFLQDAGRALVILP